MSVIENPQPETLNQTEAIRFWLLAAMLFLLTIALVLGMFSLMYLEDIATLRNAPDTIWSWVCGRPTENGVTLPLMMTGSIVAVIASAALGIGRWWISRSNGRKQKTA
jgi:hypothetical protein